MSDTKVIFERSVKGRVGFSLPNCDVPQLKISEILSKDLIRKKYAELPEVSEPQVLRHFINLSTKNHHVDKDFYPLGSCTMKYNPKINDALAGLEGFKNLHPDQPTDTVQGLLHIIYELGQMLLKITGMNDISLQPSAGSQGEYAGIMIMKTFHNLNGEDRKYILIPETAHGTNPASVTLGGFKPREIKSDIRGRVDIQDLKLKMDKDVAGMMLTQPNTLGLFEDQIEEISSVVHDLGGLMYMDGANLNAVIGLCKPSDMGFDIMHINLHKTFSTPHGGGGPGSGPVAVVEKLSPFLPIPKIHKTNKGVYCWRSDFPNSIGRLHTYFGNISILIRAYIYIRMLGDNGLKLMTRSAIINANYLKFKLKDIFDIPFSEGTLHEFVASGLKQKEKGVKVLDIAKSLLDYGFHAPTIYFPNNVEEALMIEPTESETIETLNRFADVLLEINRLINVDAKKVLESPTTTPVSRLDETKANRELNLKWSL